MKLEDARGAYEALSGKASDIVRQISLAGVGLVWIFKSPGATFSFDASLIKAALFIFLALLFDFLQYLVGAFVWFVYYRYKERRHTHETAEFLAPSQLNWPMWFLFFLKSAMMVIAYSCYIIPFLISKLES